jgi:hypothetical protein
MRVSSESDSTEALSQQAIDDSYTQRGVTRRVVVLCLLLAVFSATSFPLLM